ncbi:MAG: ABC transporter ATP-binding protein [Bacillota bacterium]
MIRLENVTKRFPGQDHPAVNNLNMFIPEGEICVLVGPSGCGKTTTMKMINRLIEPTEGKIYIKGQDTATVDVIKLRLDIGYVIQEIGLFPHLTIAENIATVPREKGWPRDLINQRVDELLTLVGLAPEKYRRRKPADLSGGQRQRVGVARAMAADPPILLMDEPFGAVDPITRARLQNEFLEIQAEMRKTIIFVTHDIDEAIKMGDKIAIMRDGELVQYAPPGELLSSPADEFVERLLGPNRTIKRLNLIAVREALRCDLLPAVPGHLSSEEARPLLKGSKLNVLAVVDSRNSLTGFVRGEQLKNNHAGPVAEIAELSSNVIAAEATLNEALSLMLGCGSQFVAVVSKKGEYKGVVTLGSLLELVREDVKEDVA